MEFDFGTQMVALVVLVALIYGATWLYRFAHRELENYRLARAQQSAQEGAQTTTQPLEVNPATTTQAQAPATGESVTIRTQTGASVWNRVQTTRAVPQMPPKPARWTALHQRVYDYLRQNPAISAFELQQKIYPGTSRGRKTTEISTIMGEVKLFLSGNGTRNVPVPASSSRSGNAGTVEEGEE